MIDDGFADSRFAIIPTERGGMSHPFDHSEMFT